MRERIRLTPEERHQLEQIEQRLRAEDPALVRRLGWTSSRRERATLAIAAARRSSRAVPALAVATMVMGALLMVAGMPSVPLAVVGYLTMAAGALVLGARSPHAMASAARRVRDWWRSAAGRLSS